MQSRPVIPRPKAISPRDFEGVDSAVLAPPLSRIGRVTDIASLAVFLIADPPGLLEKPFVRRAALWWRTKQDASVARCCDGILQAMAPPISSPVKYHC